MRAVTIDQISDKELAPHTTSSIGLSPLGFMDVFISPWVKFTPTMLPSHCLVSTSCQCHWKGEHSLRTAFTGVMNTSESWPKKNYRTLSTPMPHFTDQSHWREWLQPDLSSLAHTRNSQAMQVNFWFSFSVIGAIKDCFHVILVGFFSISNFFNF